MFLQHQSLFCDNEHLVKFMNVGIMWERREMQHELVTK